MPRADDSGRGTPRCAGGPGGNPCRESTGRVQEVFYFHNRRCERERRKPKKRKKKNELGRGSNIPDSRLQTSLPTGLDYVWSEWKKPEFVEGAEKREW